ncbi:unnamed protein product, partial [Rotaria sordida]
LILLVTALHRPLSTEQYIDLLYEHWHTLNLLEIFQYGIQCSDELIFLNLL